MSLKDKVINLLGGYTPTQYTEVSAALNIYKEDFSQVLSYCSRAPIITTPSNKAIAVRAMTVIDHMCRDLPMDIIARDLCHKLAEEIMRTPVVQYELVDGSPLDCPGTKRYMATITCMRSE